MHGAPRVMACGTSDRAKDWVQHLLTDLQGTLAQGLCLPVTSAFPIEDSQVVEGGGHLQGGELAEAGGPCSPPPSLPSLNCCSLQGVQALASAPGFVGHREEGP